MVRFSPRAQRRVRLVAAWWRKNRPSAPMLFDDELHDAIEALEAQPTIGSVYRTVEGEVMRRLLLPRSAQHVYYAADEASGILIVHAVWGARRGRGPRF